MTHQIIHLVDNILGERGCVKCGRCLDIFTDVFTLSPLRWENCEVLNANELIFINCASPLAKIMEVHES